MKPGRERGRREKIVVGVLALTAFAFYWVGVVVYLVAFGGIHD